MRIDAYLMRIDAHQQKSAHGQPYYEPMQSSEIPVLRRAIDHKAVQSATKDCHLSSNASPKAKKEHVVGSIGLNSDLTKNQTKE